MLITHAKYNDLLAYFSLQLFSGQFPSELQSPVNISLRVEIPLGMENTGSTHKAMGTPSRLFVTWQLVEVPQCFFVFCFQMLGFFHCGLYDQVFFLSIGGWMMVLNVILPSNQSSRWNGTAEQTFRGMRNHGNGKMAITKSAMKQLRAYINQIRFHCGKKKEQHSTSERLWTKKVRKWCDISAVKEMRSQTRATPSSVWMVITQDWLRIVRDGHIMVSGDMSAMVLKRIVCTTTQHMWVAGITG